LVGVGKLQPFGAGAVFPHEKTLAAPKADRLNLMRACHANLSPIFLLYYDPAGEIENSIVRFTSSIRPLIDVQEVFGSTHRLWRLDDAAVTREIQSAFEDKLLVIADGHHVHPASLRVALGAKRRGQVVLVSDAMPTVGSTLTEFRLGGQRVELKDGVLRNRRGSLAGSHLNMLEAVRNVISLTGNHWTEAVRMASSYPARAIGVADRRGFLARGYRADLVELNEDMSLHRTWVSGAPPERD